MSDRAAKGRAAPVLALLSLFLFAGGCRKPDVWEFFLADGAGKRLGATLPAGQAARAVYRPKEPTVDQIGFQLSFRDEQGNWELMSLIVEKPETPAPFVACDLHTEELPPGSYLVLLLRNDKELSTLIFTIAPPTGTGKARPGGETPGPGPTPAGAGGLLPAKAVPPRRATPPPPSAFEEFVAVSVAPTPESESAATLDPEAMPTPESNLDPAPEAPAETGPLPTPEPEVLGPEDWNLETGTEILVFKADDGYWHPATVVRAYARVFTVRYFNPEFPEEDLEREKFRVRSLAEGMEVKILEEDEPIDGVIVERQGRNFSVALRADGAMRNVAGGKIAVAAP